MLRKTMHIFPFIIISYRYLSPTRDELDLLIPPKIILLVCEREIIHSNLLQIIRKDHSPAIIYILINAFHILISNRQAQHQFVERLGEVQRNGLPIQHRFTHETTSKSEQLHIKTMVPWELNQGQFGVGIWLVDCLFIRNLFK